MRYRITLEYDGARYHGWQKQPKEPLTVQETVENAVMHIAGSYVKVTASGRTDEGVHALGQVAHFDCDNALPCERMKAALNHWLPDDVRVTECETAPDTFDARKSAKRKTYMYRFYVSDTESPLRRTRECYGGTSLDVAAMDDAAKLFVGTHDFAAFMSSGSSAKTSVRTVFDASVKREGISVVFSVTGNGFLYNMVRIMAGALLKVGKGGGKERIEKALAEGDRRLVPDIAPPYALYLVGAEYGSGAKIAQNSRPILI